MNNDSNVQIPVFPDSSPNVRRGPGRPRKEGNVGEVSERKTSIYLKGDLLKVVQEEAARQDRSVSYIIGRALTLAMDQLRSMPGA